VWGALQGVKVVSCSAAQAGTVPYVAQARVRPTIKRRAA
jgi:hypothetical protein